MPLLVQQQKICPVSPRASSDRGGNAGCIENGAAVCRDAARLPHDHALHAGQISLLGGDFEVAVDDAAGC